ncbi:ABC transporter substrate-binding protein [Nocardia tengchongensis]
MRKTPLKALVAAAVLGSAMISAACGTDAAATGSRVVIGIAEAPRTLDPVQASDIQNDLAVTGVYDTLLAYDANGALQPQVATAWTYSPDGRTLTLSLRDGLRFHSGNALTATDVVYTLERIKQIGAGVAGYMPNFGSATATDASHVTITLTQPDLQFAGVLSKVYLLDSALVESHADADHAQSWLATHDAGSGPYSIDAYTANTELDLTRSPGYRQFDDARPEHLTFRYITESATRAAELRSGGIDVTARLAATDLRTVSADHRFTVTSLPTLNETMVMMNAAGGITADKRVRQAVQLAYDYRGHLDTVLGGQGVAATGLVAPSVNCRTETAAGQQDLARARQLVTDAGATGKSLVMVYQAEFPEQASTATLLQSNLQQIGLTVNLKPVTFPQYLQMIATAGTEPDLGVLWDNPNYPEVGAWLAQRFATASVGSNNWARYSNPRVDQLLADGARATDAAAACTAFRQAQQAILDDAVSMNIANPATVVVTDSKVAAVPNDPAFVIFDPKLVRLAAH